MPLYKFDLEYDLDQLKLAILKKDSNDILKFYERIKSYDLGVYPDDILDNYDKLVDQANDILYHENQ